MGKKRRYPRGNTIVQEKLLPVLLKYKEVKIFNNTSPLRIKFGNHYYYLYVKCISGGGAEQYTDNQTRAQLDSNAAFDEIKKSDDRFLFLGYDIDNDVFVCWDPIVIKDRLNKKSNVAIWSRRSFQENAIQGEIRKYQILRNPALVTFRRIDILSFLEMIEIHFPNLIDENKPKSEELNPKEKDNNGVLDSVETDIAIKLFIDEKIAQKTSTTMIVNKVMGEFCKKYPYMKYGDWSRTIRQYMEKYRTEE